MSASFAVQLRTSGGPIVLAEGADTITLRVQAADIWETVAVTARPSTTVAEVKRRVVSELLPADHPSEFVLKLSGWEMLDESAGLADSGVVDGAILLLAFRRRRAVR